MWVKIASASQGLCQHPHSFSLWNTLLVSPYNTLAPVGDLKRCLVLKTGRWDEGSLDGLWIFLEAGLRIQWGCGICAPFYFSMYLLFFFLTRKALKCAATSVGILYRKKTTQWPGIYSLVTLLRFFQICVVLQSMILNPRSEKRSHSPEGHCVPHVVWPPW